MSGDDLLSKKLSEIEERKIGYLARRVEASDKEKADAGPVDSGATAVTGGEPETAVGIQTPGATTVTGVEPEVSGIPPSTSESRLCTWIECSHDKRTLAEVQEEGQNEMGGWGSETVTCPHPITQAFCHSGSS